MTLDFWYWLLMLIWLIASLIYGRRARRVPNPPPGPVWAWVVGDLFLFALFFLIGLKVFGDPLGTLVK